MKIDNKTECIFEKVFIETPVDTDGDGMADLVAAYIRRPAFTLNGEKVPALRMPRARGMTMVMVELRIGMHQPCTPSGDIMRRSSAPARSNMSTTARRARPGNTASHQAPEVR